jgi:glycosyltransferase involved in cell wall biosynthesis
MPITIGIPFYNAEAYLADAIRSVFAQTHQEWELILVDDGSADRSLEIARAVKDPRVRVISDGQNKRLPYRLNQIASEARFDFVGRMDADDLISPTRFEKQIEILNMNVGYDLVTAGICSITNDNRPVGVRFGSPNDSITGRKLLLGQCAVVHAAILGRKSWFLRNPYDTTADRMEDYELWLRAYSKNDFRLYILSEPLYYYREEENVTPKRILRAYAGQRQLVKSYGHLWFNRFEIPLAVSTLYGKSFVVRILSASNKMDILLKRRNREIEDQESMDTFAREIDQVLKTKVPGLD